MGRLLVVVSLALFLLSMVVGPRIDAHGPAEPVVDAYAAFAARHGVPASFVERGGTEFLLVAPGQFPWHAPSGDVHTVTMRLPYYIASSPVARRSTWHEVQELAARMTEANGDHRYRLPTEAEWALAQRRHPPKVGTTIGSWCADWFGPHPEQDLSDPVGPREGRARVVRQPGRVRCGVDPEQKHGSIGVRLVAEIGWRGDREVVFRTVVRDRAGQVVREAPGHRLRIIRILDRLGDRQAGRVEEWTDLPGTTPMQLRMFPGRYYVNAVIEGPDGTALVTTEHKILIEEGGHRFDVDVPGSR
ncbi:MAG: hypothetical protein QNJ98_00810 [Planctomycetota bacterium]|nr:hypothetical protein [Planctomycetota bacterium]